MSDRTLRVESYKGRDGMFIWWHSLQVFKGNEWKALQVVFKLQGTPLWYSDLILKLQYPYCLLQVIESDWVGFALQRLIWIGWHRSRRSKITHPQQRTFQFLLVVPIISVASGYVLHATKPMCRSQHLVFLLAISIISCNATSHHLCWMAGQARLNWSHVIKSDLMYARLVWFVLLTLCQNGFSSLQTGQKSDWGLQHKQGLSLANSVVGNGSSRKYGSCSACSEVIRLVGSIVRSFWSWKQRSRNWMKKPV